MSQYVLESLGEDAQWWIDNTVAVIENKRREGWSDAQITAWLFTPEGKAATGIIGGPPQTTVAAAFAYLATGKKSTSSVMNATATTATASTGMSTNTKLAIGAAAAIGAYVLFFRKGR